MTGVKKRKNPVGAAIQDQVEEAAKTFGVSLLQQILLALVHGATPEQRQLFSEAHDQLNNKG